MKNIYFIVCVSFLLFKNSCTKAQTNVGGLISTNTTWTLSGSPYIVVNNVLVDSAITLTIQPGVIIKLNSGRSIQIRGILRASGTSFNKIKFTSNLANPQPADWKNILFYTQAQSYDSTSGTGCIMNHCIVEYAGVLDSLDFFGAIRFYKTNPLIKNCTIRYNSCNGIYGEWLNGILKIDSCGLEGNFGNGIRLFSETSDTISTSISIENCNSMGNQSNGIRVDGGEVVKINNNYIIANSSSFFLTGENVSMKNNLIKENLGGAYVSGLNEFSNNIYLYNKLNFIIYNDLGTYGTFTKNIIVGNVTGSDYFSGSIAIYNADSAFSIYKNVFAYNTGNGIFMQDGNYSMNTIFANQIAQHSITHQGKGVGTFNTICKQSTLPGTNPTTLLMGNNTSPYFKNNNVFHNEGYEYSNNRYLQTDPDFYITNNWWGTSVDFDIQTEIYDWFDNSTLGIVRYQPFLVDADTIAPISPPDSVVKTDLGSGNINVKWNANPEMDLAGYKIYWGSPSGYSFANSIDVGNVTTYTLTGINFSDTIAVTAYDNSIDGFEDQFDGNESWFSYDQLAFITGIRQSSINSSIITAFPNPFCNDISIKTFKELKNGEIKIYNLLGEEVESRNNLSGSEVNNLGEKLANGFYVLIIKQNSSIVGSIKLIKQ